MKPGARKKRQDRGEIPDLSPMAARAVLTDLNQIFGAIAGAAAGRSSRSRTSCSPSAMPAPGRMRKPARPARADSGRRTKESSGTGSRSMSSATPSRPP